MEASVLGHLFQAHVNVTQIMCFHCESLYIKDAQKILVKTVIMFEKKVLGSPTC